MLLSSLVVLVLAAPVPGSLAEDEDVTTIRLAKFVMPLSVDPDRRDEIKQIHLYVSTDRGRTWRKAASAKAADKTIAYTAEHDGLHWFAVGVTDQQGKNHPENLEELKPLQKVLIDTGTLPRLVLKPAPSPTRTLEQEVLELKAKLTELEKRLAEKR